MNKFDLLEKKIIELGNFAKENQKNIDFTLKKDGSILTETDTYISNNLIDFLINNFPTCSIISEEVDDNKISRGPYIFIIDPIDGTDMYSQGLPSFCVSIGILDSKTREAIGAFIYAPRFGIGTDSFLLRLDPTSNTVYFNKKPYKPNFNRKKIDCITMGSNMSKLINQENILDIKIRSFGSNILHMVLPMITNRLSCCISPSCYVWDMASSHALANNFGYITCYADGKPFIYTNKILLNRNMFKGPLYCGEKHLFSLSMNILK